MTQSIHVFDAIILKEIMITATARGLLSLLTRSKYAFEVASVNRWIRTIFY